MRALLLSALLAAMASAGSASATVQLCTVDGSLRADCGALGAHAWVAAQDNLVLCDPWACNVGADVAADPSVCLTLTMLQVCNVFLVADVDADTTRAGDCAAHGGERCDFLRCTADLPPGECSTLGQRLGLRV